MRIEPYGEAAVLVVLADDVDLASARRARRLAAAVTAMAPGIAGWGAPVQGIASVLVPFDPLSVSVDDVTARLEPLVAALPADPAADDDARLMDIPVRYGGEDGPDIDDVAELTGLSTTDIVERHAGAVLEVLMLGFAPGFPYLGVMDPALTVPRRATPRPRVAAGSVGLAGRMTGIYPADLPGGWRIIGRTDLRLFDPAADAAGPPATRRSRAVRTGRAAMSDRDVLEVVDGGLLTTVQDRGRPGWAGAGVPHGGACDPWSLAVANVGCGNSPDLPALELTLIPPTLRVVRDAVLSLAGADLGIRHRRATLERPFLPGSAIHVVADDLLVPGSPSGSGARAYLAVAGGIDVPRVLGSMSTALAAGFGGFDGRALRAGDRLAAAPAAPGARHAAPHDVPPIVDDASSPLVEADPRAARAAPRQTRRGHPARVPREPVAGRDRQ